MSEIANFTPSNRYKWEGITTGIRRVLIEQNYNDAEKRADFIIDQMGKLLDIKLCESGFDAVVSIPPKEEYSPEKMSVAIHQLQLDWNKQVTALSGMFLSGIYSALFRLYDAEQELEEKDRAKNVFKAPVLHLTDQPSKKVDEPPPSNQTPEAPQD
jgi:hypothetical protein